MAKRNGFEAHPYFLKSNLEGGGRVPVLICSTSLGLALTGAVKISEKAVWRDGNVSHVITASSCQGAR